MMVCLSANFDVVVCIQIVKLRLVRVSSVKSQRDQSHIVNRTLLVLFDAILGVYGAASANSGFVRTLALKIMSWNLVVSLCVP